MKHGRRTHLALIGSFLILLTVPHLVELAGLASSTASDEKRVMATRPDSRLLFSSFSEYARRFDRFYGDSFGVRDGLIRWNNRLRLFVFNESPVRGVRVGREGWFFYADEWVLEDYENVMPLKPRELDTIVQGLEKRSAWLEARGIELFVLAVPEKHTIYGEYLPPSIHKLGGESRLDQLARALESHPNIPFIDSREPLLKAKAAGRLYHKTDSHWNDSGALVAYGALMEPIARRFPAIPVRGLDDYAVVTTVGSGGDLAGMLSLRDLIKEERITLVPKFTPRAADGARPYPDPVDPAVYPGRDMVVKETRDSSLPKALVFRDSYSGALIPFLAESFQSVVFVWTFDFLPELIEQEKPDIVIIECVERYLTGLTR
jgi:alginate O-acetyltransferase complex protein AlgJ